MEMLKFGAKILVVEVMKMVESIPALRAVDGGPLLMSRYVESVTALLLNLNFKHKARTSIRITGI